MSVYRDSSGVLLPAPPFWLCMLLGLVLLLVGLFVLGDVALASFISAWITGLAAMAAGAFEIVHAVWTKGWGGIVWHLVLGSIYIAFGIVLITQPTYGAFVLTYALGILFVLSGVVRILLGVSQWRQDGWIMLASGVFGVVAGVIVLTGMPTSGLWALGVLLGLDLITHGIAWLTFAWLPSWRSGT